MDQNGVGSEVVVKRVPAVAVIALDVVGRCAVGDGVAVVVAILHGDNGAGSSRDIGNAGIHRSKILQCHVMAGVAVVGVIAAVVVRVIWAQRIGIDIIDDALLRLAEGNHELLGQIGGGNRCEPKRQ